MNPTPNKTNGNPPEADGRDKKGRFAQGNPGGPGNPFARRTAALRSAMMDAVSKDDLKEVVKAILKKAKDGDLAAAKLLLAYAVGKPQDAPNPDAVEIDAAQLRARERVMRESEELDEMFSFTGK